MGFIYVLKYSLRGQIETICLKQQLVLQNTLLHHNFKNKEKSYLNKYQ